MRKTRFILITVIVLLSLVLVSAALADSRSGDSGNPGEPSGQEAPPTETQTDSQSDEIRSPNDPSGQENPQFDKQPIPQSGDGPESLGGSVVTFDPSVGGEDSYDPGLNQTFCFRAESFTDDTEYVETLWQRFPDDWEISNIYVEGTPSCDMGGTFGAFSWGSVGGNLNEIRIDHFRFQANPDDQCTAYYCFETLTGTSPSVEALVSWYWKGDEFASTPHFVCSSDNYTPVGEPACEEAVNPPAAIPISFLQGDFELKASSSVPLTSVAVDPTSGYIYAQQDGGFDFFRYDPAADAWTALSDAPLDSGNNGGAAYLDGKIYTTYTGRNQLGVYNVASDTWTTIPSDVPNTNVIASDGQYLYLVWFSTFKRYDPVSAVWTDLALPPFGFQPWGGLSYWDGTLYGHEGNGSTGFAKYDIAGDTWTTLTSVPDGAVLGSAIDPGRGYYYAYGNYGFDNWYVFNLASENWSVETIPFFSVLDGGMAYVDTPGLTGVYFVQGELNFGFARYGPPLLLQPESIEVWLPAGNGAYTYPTSLEITNNTGMDLGFEAIDTTSDGCLVALTEHDYTTPEETTELHATLDEFGYSWLDISSVQEAVDAGADTLIVRYAGVTPTGDLNTWVDTGHGSIHLARWADWFPVGLEDQPSDTPLTIDVANFRSPLTRGLPPSWTGLGFHTYAYAPSDFVGWVTDVGSPNLISAKYGTLRDRAVTVTEFGDGRAAYIGFNVYGSKAGAQDKQVLKNAIDWTGDCADAPWLSEDPNTGTVPAGGTTNVKISFTTLVPDPLPIGTYTAMLEISNYVGGSLQSIPVTMHVIPVLYLPIVLK